MPKRTRRASNRRKRKRRPLRSRGIEAPKALGQQLLGTMEDVIHLLKQTQDPDRRKELDKLRRSLSDQAGRLIDAALDASRAEYRAATTGLEEASATIRNAIKGLEAVKTAILTTAKALELVAEVAA